MRRMVRLLLAFLTLLPTGLVGQDKPPVPPPSQATSPSDPIRRLNEFHHRAYEALRAEQEPAKKPLCPKALTTLDINQCTAHELDVTDRNYTAEIRALGALLSGLEDLPRGSVAAPPFDEAEATWHTYREQACNAFAGPPKNAGTLRTSRYGSCLITVTRYHMNALGDLYTGVGMH